MTPYVNSLSFLISGFPEADDTYWYLDGVYPGEKHCRGYSPHALWHEESS